MKKEYPCQVDWMLGTGYWVMGTVFRGPVSLTSIGKSSNFIYLKPTKPEDNYKLQLLLLIGFRDYAYNLTNKSGRDGEFK